MPGSGAFFSYNERVEVLKHYDIGEISELKPLLAGSRRTPKMIIVSQKGKFLLKRRRKGKDDLHRVAFAHAVQNHLTMKKFPVPKLIQTIDENSTILQLDNHIYELFEFIEGLRYDSSPQATTDAGRQLAKFHKFSSDFMYQWKPLRGSLHDSPTVRGHLKAGGSDEMADSTWGMRNTVRQMRMLYDRCSQRVNDLGYKTWTKQVTHGDWHPGNMLFEEGKLTAVFDFDLIKISPNVTDLANGLLQFSIVGDKPNPIEWSDYLDQNKLLQFINGYRQVIALDKNKLHALPDLMIETIIAEAILPVVVTGFFGYLSGADFLAMILRKAEWIEKHREVLTKLIDS